MPPGPALATSASRLCNSLAVVKLLAILVCHSQAQRRERRYAGPLARAKTLPRGVRLAIPA
jgi:hypothetical protein